MLKNVLLTGVGLALLGLVRLGFNAVALRVFGEEAAGAANVALSLAVLASLPASTALGGTTVRYLAQARAQGRLPVAGALYRTFLWLSVGLAMVSALVLWLVRNDLSASQHLTTSLVTQALWVSVAYVLYLFFRNVFYGLNRVADYTRVEIISGTSFFVTLFTLAITDAGGALLVAFGVSYSTFSVVALWRTRHVITLPRDPTLPRPSVQEMVSYSIVALVGTASSLAVRELAVFFAPKVAGLGGAATLALVFSLLSPLQVFPRMLRTALFAHTAELSGQGKTEELAKSISEASHWLVLVTVPACGLIALLGEPLFTLLGGTPTPERLMALRLLVLAALVDVVATPAANGLVGAGRVWIPNVAAVVALAASSLVWWGLAGQHGLVGLALGMLCNSLIKGGMPIASAYARLGAALTRAPWRALVMAGLAGVSLVSLGRIGQPWVIGAFYAAACAWVLWAPLRELVALAKLRMRSRRASA